jgi:hypothetical protein
MADSKILAAAPLCRGMARPTSNDSRTGCGLSERATQTALWATRRNSKLVSPQRSVIDLSIGWAVSAKGWAAKAARANGKARTETT